MKRKTKKVLFGVLLALLTGAVVGLVAHETNQANGWWDNIVEKVEDKEEDKNSTSDKIEDSTETETDSTETA